MRKFRGFMELIFNPVSLIIFLMIFGLFYNLFSFQTHFHLFRHDKNNESPAPEEPQFWNTLTIDYLPNQTFATCRSSTNIREFFSNKKVSAFRNEYLTTLCSGAKLPYYTAVIQGNKTGFGSFLNNALNVFLIASEPSINRKFGIIFSQWMHLKWSAYFLNISANRSCDLIKEPNVLDQELVDVGKRPVFSTPKNRTLELLGPPQCFFVDFPPEPAYLEFNGTIEFLYNRDGWRALFLRKSYIAQAIWEPRNDLKNLVQRFVDVLNCGNFAAVHVRRGDKYGREMDKLKIEQYSKAIRENCIYRKNCFPSIFIMSDDERVALQLKALLTSEGVNAFMFRDLVQAVKLDSRKFLLKKQYGYDREKFAKLGAMDIYIHTRELVLSLTLLSTSKMVFCTISSNLCRLVMLLRGEEGLNSTHSLDLQQWFPW